MLFLLYINIVKLKFYPIQIWFLDDDLNKSAEYLTNKELNKSINGCIQAIINTIFYYNGIRSLKFYKYYFSKPRYDSSMDAYFQFWPLKDKPSFKLYTSKTSKWCRQCKEHFEYVRRYLDILFNEFEYRYNKPHKKFRFSEWLDFECKVNIPMANIKSLVLPWKNLNPKYRRKNIIDGYRLQYIKSFSAESVFEEFKDSKRDIPEFVTRFYQFDLENQINV